MKGIHGLILAMGLGIAGALFNYAYLARKSRDVQKVNFIGIKSDVTISRGERLTEENLVKIGIPAGNIGNLDDFAVRYSVRDTVIGAPVWRTLPGGSLLLEEYLKTPPQELKFGKDLPSGQKEGAMWIPVDTRAFVPSLVLPGDMVSFVVSQTPTIAPPRVDPENPEAAVSAPPAPSGATELIGPFKVLSLGNRLGSAEVMRAAKNPQRQENVMTIAVEVHNNKLEPKADKLFRYLQATNFRGVGIFLHPRKTKSQ